MLQELCRLLHELLKLCSGQLVERLEWVGIRPVL